MLDKKAKIYRSYALVVIESIWPRYLDYRGESKQKNILATIDTKNDSFEKFSTYQDKYLGYYKIIPLNVLNLSTSSSKEGNSFNVTFTANKLIFYAEGIIPERLKILLENEPKITIPLDKYPFLEKVLSGTTKEPEVYITNYNTIADFLNEMDTVSIYVINVPEEFALNIPDKNYASLLEVFTGANPGRLKQPELESLSNDILKKLNDIGISINEKQYLEKINDPDQKIKYFRNFSLNSLFKTKFKFTNFFFPLIDKNERDKVKQKELESLNKINPDEFITDFGQDIYNNYFGIKDYQKKLKSCIESFYSSSRYKDVMSWSAYETFKIRIKEFLGLNLGLCFEKMSDNVKKSFVKILDTILIENFLLIYAPSSFELDSYERIKTSLSLILGAQKLSVVCSSNEKDSNKAADYCATVYIAGVDEFLNVLKNRIKNVGGQHTFIKLPDFNESLKINFSGDGLGLLMRGHITSINRSLRIGDNEADLSISISGKGFEHPLNKHEIVPDLTSIKFAVQNFSNYSIQISTPIDAVKYIIETFAPYRINVKEMTDTTLFSSIISSRGFDAYYSTGSRYLVNQGNVVAPKFDAKFEELIVFTPIHYVSLDILKVIQNSFEHLAASQKYLANVNRTLSKGSIMDNIKSIISKGSMYRVYVDHMGYLRIEFEPIHISAPFSLNLNTPITEENTFSLDHSSSEDNVRTFVEVFPSSLGINSPSEAGIASIYGRSVAKNIEDIYTSNTYINSNNAGEEKFINFLKQVINIIDKHLKNSIIKQKTDELKKIENELNKLSSFLNKQSPDKVVAYFKRKTEKKPITTPVTSRELINKTTTKVDYCTGQKITVNDYELKEETKLQQSEQEVPVPLFNPNILINVYNVGPISENYFSEVFYKEGFYLPIASFNTSIIDILNLLNSSCEKINKLAQDMFNLPKNSSICYTENLDAFASLMILGDINTVFGNYKKTNTEYGRLVTNFINSLSIRSSFSSFKLSFGSFKDPKNKGQSSYLLDNLYYIVPYTDLDIQSSSTKFTYKNLSPDMFIYGLRTITFEDSFIAMYDAVKNESRLSAKRAEIIRRLNSVPINNVKATIYGDIYYVGFTTLVVNENLPPLKGYINKKLLDDIEDDASYIKKDSKNLIVYVNEIIETNAFKDAYQKSLIKLNGYNPPVSVDYDTVINHFKKAIKYIINKGEFNNYPTDSYIPLFGIYEEETLKNKAIKGYIDFFVKEPYYRTPDYNPSLSKETDEFIEYIKKYGQFINEYRKYLRPQNYLVAQGHIENVETNWSIGNIFTSTVGLNYLFPALYTYVLINGRKIILGYVVINSPLSKYESFSGQINEFFNDTDWLEVLRMQKSEYMKFYKDSLGFIKNKAKLIAIETSLDKE